MTVEMNWESIPTPENSRKQIRSLPLVKHRLTHVVVSKQENYKATSIAEQAKTEAALVSQNAQGVSGKKMMDRWREANRLGTCHAY